MAGGTQGTGRMNFQVPDEMRTMAERSVTQARQALESFLQATRRTAESMEQTSDKVQAGTKDAVQKALSAVEQNLRASLDYAERLVRARDLQEITQIQSEFARTQRGHADPDEGERVVHAVGHGGRQGHRAIGG